MMERKKGSKFFNLILIIVIGGLSGILGCQVLLPWLAKFAFFEKISWIRQAQNGVTIINKTERVVISDDQGLQDAINQVKGVVVGVTALQTEKTVNKKKVVLEKPETVIQGSGLIVSSDGLIVTDKNLVPDSAQNFFILLDGKQSAAEVKKRDENSGLALLKISEQNLPVLAFGEDQLRLGEEVFLIGAKSSNQLERFIDTAVINELGDQVSVDFSRKDIDGAPIFNLKSEIVGINIFDASSGQKIITADKIVNFLK